MNRVRRWSGDPVAIVAFLAMAVALVLLAAYALKPRVFVTGGNGVRALSFIATVPAGHSLCADDVAIPAETSGIQFALAPAATPTTARVTVKAGARTLRASLVDVSVFDRQIAWFPAIREPTEATVCIRAGKADVIVAGAAGLQSNDVPLRLAGESLDARLSMLFFPKQGTRRSLAEQWSAVMDRASVFRPGFVTSSVLWFVLLVALPAAIGVSIVGVARCWSGRRAVVLLGVVAFIGGASWAVTTLPFDSPDESEHFAYVQSLAERQTRPDSSPSEQGTYSTRQTLALEAIRHPTRIGGADQRPPWDERARERYDATLPDAPVDNGGGYAEATRLHLPAYYSLLLPGYKVGGEDIWTELTLARLMSALLGVIVALCAFGIVRELLPARPELALTAGVLVALHPMFSFIAGAVNNDGGVNAGAALVAYLGVRLLRRPSPWVVIAFAAALAVTPLLKATGLALYPPALLALAGYAWRHPRWRTTVPVLVGVAVTVFVVSRGLRALMSAAVAAGAPGINGGEGVVDAGILGSLRGRLSYTWQTVFPRAPFMQDYFPMMWPFYDIYIVRGWGAFGWYSFLFPKWVYTGIVGLLASILVLGVVGLWRRRRGVATWLWEVGFLIAVPVTVFTAIAFAYYSEVPREVPGEQGRYLFTAAAPLAALAVGALLGLPARWQRSAAAVLVVAMGGLAMLGRLCYLNGVFT